jgi:hypothetical protein
MYLAGRLLRFHANGNAERLRPRRGDGQPKRGSDNVRASTHPEGIEALLPHRLTPDDLKIPAPTL